MLIKRREFLKLGSLASASLMLPKILKALEPQQLLAGNKVLVVVQFSGGNDGLNTVVPISNDLYYAGRPSIAIGKQNALQLNTDAGLNPVLTSLADLHHEGALGILNNVGYAQPDRSHFRSMDIWQSASKSNEYINTGWLGRYLDTTCNNCKMPVQAMELDDMLSLALKGEQQKGISLKDPRKFHNNCNNPMYQALAQQHNHEEETVDYLYKTFSSALNSADYIFEKSKMRSTLAEYPATEFGKNLKTIASLIQSDISTKVYYVSIGSFDTHVNQAPQQSRLLKEFNDGIGAFVKDLKSNRRFDDVLIATFSEFGRRVKQNASNGTDHGTANNMFFIGGGLKQKGLLNAMPDLKNLNDGDLVHQVDFKQVYATLLNNWLGANDEQILLGKYERLNFI